MSAIAESDAVHETQKILPQHQSAITLLNVRLHDPTVGAVRWLDIACGKGQIIAQLDDNLSPDHRAKLSYVGYDINSDFIRTAEKLAEGLGLQSVSFLHGDLSNFSKLVPEDRKFDFISCTNTAHEIQRGCFACLFLDALLHLSESGELFIYDMESLTKPELGALPWQSQEIKELINAAFETMGIAFRAYPSA
jgi:SAM-dependent methyltransferase